MKILVTSFKESYEDEDLQSQLQKIESEMNMLRKDPEFTREKYEALMDKRDEILKKLNNK